MDEGAPVPVPARALSTLPRRRSRFGRSSEASLGRARFPLQERGLLVGILAGVLAGVALNSLIAGFAVLVLFLCVGSTWIAGEIPVFPAVLAFQWLTIVAGYFYWLVLDVYPGFSATGALESAVLVSLVGQLFLVMGIRLAIRGMEPATVRRLARIPAMPAYDPRRLFGIVIVVYAADWLVDISPMRILFAAAQILHALFQFKSALLLLLFLTILQQRRHYHLALLAALYVLVPALSSTGSAFSGVFFLFFFALLAVWRPWRGSTATRRRNSRVLTAAVFVALATLILGLFWEGGIKDGWRTSVRSGVVTGSPLQRAQQFGAFALQEAPRIDLAMSYPQLTRRLSSEIGFFSFVLERVPGVVPHSGGELTLRAVRHVTRPRFIFPDKANLGGDSWLVGTYAGIPVAGDDQGTSIGLGYIPELYIDFGVPVMFVPLFVLGVILGLCYRLPLLFAPSYSFYLSAVTPLMFFILSGYGGELAKVLGALIVKSAVFCAILATLGGALHRFLPHRGGESEAAIERRRRSSFTALAGRS